MKFVLVSNRTLEELNRTINKSNRTLVEWHKRHLLNEDTDYGAWREIENAIDNAIDNLTYQQLDKIMKGLGGYVNDFNGGAPYFIDRYGDIISAEDSYASDEKEVGDTIHYDYAGYVFDQLLKCPSECQEYVDNNIYGIEDSMLDKMLSLGVIRVNTGTSDVEERCYCALPDKKDFVLNDSQYDALDKFFWWAKEHGNEVQVYFGEDSNLYYLFDEKYNTPEKLIERVKQYYSGMSVKEALNEDENNPDIEKQRDRKSVV